MQNVIYSAIQNIESVARNSKLERLRKNPFKYIFAILYRIFWYRLTFKSIEIITKTAWGDTMFINLPAGTDIFLTGGKSDDSEIRLSKFIVNYLGKGETFVDVGSHFGFYSLLAHSCVCETGNVISIEGSIETMRILNKNTENFNNIKTINCVVGAEIGDSVFFEFPALYSEYNTVFPEQFQRTSWFKKIKYKKITLQKYTLDKIIEDEKIKPSMIKIDAEGSEFEIIKGLSNNLLKLKIPFICMEYLTADRENLNHKQAVSLMKSFGYKLKIIDKNGRIIDCNDIDAYFKCKNLESDNVVFCIN